VGSGQVESGIGAALESESMTDRSRKIVHILKSQIKKYLVRIDSTASMSIVCTYRYIRLPRPKNSHDRKTTLAMALLATVHVHTYM
jgi:hypothetical protein